MAQQTKFRFHPGFVLRTSSASRVFMNLLTYENMEHGIFLRNFFKKENNRRKKERVLPYQSKPSESQFLVILKEQKYDGERMRRMRSIYRHSNFQMTLPLRIFNFNFQLNFHSIK